MRISSAVELYLWSSAALNIHRPVVGSEAPRICNVKSDLYFCSSSLCSLTRPREIIIMMNKSCYQWGIVTKNGKKNCL